MLFQRKKVLCTHCGFLGFSTDAPDGSWSTELFECRQDTRHGFQTREFKGEEWNPEKEESYKLSCLRKQWILNPLAVNPSRNWLDTDAIRESRLCPYYMKYDPGYRPGEHKELKRQAETNRNTRNAALLGAVIGAGSAIIVQVLFRIL